MSDDRKLSVLAVANWDWEAERTPWAAQRIDRLRATGLAVDVLGIDCVSDRSGYLRLASALYRRLSTGNYDLVAPLYGSALGLECTLVSAAAGVKVAASFAGSDLNGRTTPGRLTFSSVACVLTSQATAALAAGVSVRNREMRASLWWPRARRRARVISSGVDTNRFRPMAREEARRRRGLPIEGKRVVFVALKAKDRPYKRLDLAQAAMAHLPGVALDVIADVPFAEMPAAYAAADALLLTSLDEGSPNCVKEALACGVPVVSVDVGDVREVMSRLTNCAVTSDDPRAIAAALGRALDDGRGCPDGPASMAEAWSLDAMTARFVDFYYAVAGREASAPVRQGRAISTEKSASAAAG